MITTLRARLTLWSAVFFAAAVLLLGGSTLALVRRQQIATLDRELRDAALAVFHELAEHGPGGVGHGWLVIDKDTHALVFGATGVEIFRSADLETLDARGFGVGAHDAGPWRVVTEKQNGYTVHMARTFTDVNATLTDIRRAFLTALPMLAVLVAAGAWVLVRAALKPVQRISSAARQVSTDHLDQRLPEPQRQDELGELTTVLNEMLDRIERGHRQAVRFTADASHELRTPLALIAAGLEELLRRRDLSPEVVATLASLLEDNRRLAATCQDLLLLARADAGRLSLDRQRADLAALVEAAVEDARILGEGRSLEFATQLPERAEEAVDARYFTRILLNLLSNAVKYSADGSTVRVSLENDAERWKVCVANTGPAIDEAHRVRLFERFFRVDNSAAAPGNGLGLSLSRELARAHGGELELTRSDGTWTAFCLTLPRTAELGERRTENLSVA